MILSGESVADLNDAVIYHGPHAEERLREFEQRIKARNLSVFVFLTDAVSTPLAPLAQRLGMQRVGEMPLMTYTPADVPAPSGDAHCERVESEPALREANRVAASAFGLPVDAVQRAWGPIMLDGPGVDVFLARHHGQAISTVQTTRMGATVGIWAMGTAASYQRKGAGRALLHHVIGYHAGRGPHFSFCVQRLQGNHSTNGLVSTHEHRLSSGLPGRPRTPRATCRAIEPAFALTAHLSQRERGAVARG